MTTSEPGPEPAPALGSALDPVPFAMPLRAPRCPICGEPNDCAPSASGSFDTPCWCRDATFSERVLARVPTASSGRACVCRRCAQQDA